MSIRHVFTNAVPDGTATSVVRPSDWNSAHQHVVGLQGNTLGVSQVSGTDVQWAGSNGVSLSGDQAGGRVVILGPQTSQFLTTAMQSNQGSAFAGLGTSTVATIGALIAATMASTGMMLAVPPFLTTAAQSADSSNYAGTGISTVATNGTGIVGTNATNGLSLAIPAFITTAALSQDSSRYAGTGFTSTSAAGAVVVATQDTAGLKLAMPAFLTTAALSQDSSKYGGTGFTGVNASGTINSNGLSLSVAAPGGGGAINVSAGTTSGNLQTINFANGNGVIFGLNGSTVTASVQTNYLTTARASNDAVGLNTGLTANGVSATINSSGLSLNFPAFLTTAAQSNHSHNFATTTTNGASIVVGTTNSAGATIGVPAFLTTAMASNASSSMGGTGFTSTSTAGSLLVGTNNSAGLSVGVPAWLTTQSVQTQASGNIAGSGFTTTTAAGATVIGTHDSAGLKLGVPSFLTTAMASNASSTLGATGFTTTTAAGAVIAATNDTSGLKLAVPAYLTTAALSADSSKYAGSGFTTTTAAGVALVATNDSNGLKLGVPAFITTAMQSNASSTLAGTGTTFGGTNVSATMALNSNGLSLALSAPTPGGGAAINVTAGAASGNLQTIQFADSNGVSWGLNGSTVTASIAGQQVITQRLQYPRGGLTPLSSFGNGSFSIQRMDLQDNISATRLDVPFLVSIASSATANTWGFAATVFGAVYTKNASTLSSLSSGSTSFSFSVASNSAGQTQMAGNAIRPLSIPMNASMTPGEYYVGFGISTNTSSLGTATTAYGISISVMGGVGYSGAVGAVGDFTATTNTSTGLFGGGPGVYSAAISTVPPAVSLSAINQTGSYSSRGNIGLLFRNI